MFVEVPIQTVVPLGLSIFNLSGKRYKAKPIHPLIDVVSNNGCKLFTLSRSEKLFWGGLNNFDMEELRFSCLDQRFPIWVA